MMDKLAVEGVICRRVDSSWKKCERSLGEWGNSPYGRSFRAKCIQRTVCQRERVSALVDAILAKNEIWEHQERWHLLPSVLGPGFVAGEDVDFVVETMRGHDLARIIIKGCCNPKYR